MSEDRGELGPLPAGRHSYSAEQVAHNQRERILAALAQVVSEKGYAAVTVTDITNVAQVSRRTFYEQFESREACFLAAYDVVVEHLHRLIAEAAGAEEDWPRQINAAFGELLAFFDAEPQLAKLCLVDSLTAGAAIAERSQQAILGFVPLLKPGREQHKGKDELPDSTEDTILGSVISAITREIIAGRVGKLTDLREDLVSFALTPYIGPKRAAKFAAEQPGGAKAQAALTSGL